MTHTLLDQQTGEVAFRVCPLTDAISSSAVSRHNQYTLLLLQSGMLTMTIDFAAHTIAAKSLVCLSPYQPHAVTAVSNVAGWLLYFHPDFFCTYKHQHEIALEGALFHNNYQLSFFAVYDDTLLDTTLRQIRAELTKQGLAQHELLVSYLKIYLIHALRLKADHETLSVPTNELPLPLPV